MLTVVKIKQTCSACPSQWEGRLDDGRYIYVRYRWGGLGVGVGASLEDAVKDDFFYECIGDGMDGFLTYDELRTNTKNEISWPFLCEDSEII